MSFMAVTMIIIGVALSVLLFINTMQDDIIGELDQEWDEQLNVVNYSCDGNEISMYIENTHDGPFERTLVDILVLEGGEDGETFEKNDVEFKGDFLEGQGSDFFETTFDNNSFEPGNDYRIILSFTRDEISFLCRADD